jgi:hypothetical protein
MTGLWDSEPYSDFLLLRNHLNNIKQNTGNHAISSLIQPHDGVSNYVTGISNAVWLLHINDIMT